MATAQAIVHAGGIPVFAEIEEDLTLSPADLESLLHRHADVGMVIPVHMYGLPCQVDRIQAVADDYAKRAGRPLPVIYDAAHAFGSSVNGRKVGSFGAAEVFSLSVTKVVVTVEGGLVASRDPELIRRLKKMRNYGIEENYDAFWPGLNGKMSELHAIVGNHNLRRIEHLMSERQRKAAYYFRGIRKNTRFTQIPCPQGVVHTFKDLTIFLPAVLRGRRPELMAFLKEQGIETRAYFYPPVHEQHYFRKYADRSLPVTEELSRQVLTLPFYTSISETDMDYVIGALAEAERKLT
jgi:dTDP-4-amino-4,6-dideoxygalactose transaminase